MSSYISSLPLGRLPVSSPVSQPRPPAVKTPVDADRWWPRTRGDKPKSSKGGPERDRSRAVRDEKVKRVVDVILATVGLVLASPLLMLVALAIRLDSPGPVLFRQRRHGRHGVAFDIVKFRSMQVQPSAEFRQASRGDRRVTRVGRVIRRFSIDELPQLLNVIGGSMSLVGPRPHPPELDARFYRVVPALGARYAVKPGITGWAQINGSRGETREVADMRRRVALDRHYVEHRTVALDVRILVHTVLFCWSDARAY